MIRCKKCLLGEINQDEFIKSLRHYISDYPKEKRADEAEYKRRLSLCLECGQLESAMCRKCGCFVELRALKKNAVCADFPRRW